MSKVMVPTSMKRLLERIAGEWRAKRQILDLPEAAVRGSLALEARSPGVGVMGSEVSIPVGPAAGPHTQIAEGLIAA